LFENKTYENLMQECFDLAPPDIDLRQGGIYFDAVSSACMKLAQFYVDLTYALDLVFVTTAVGEYLDRRGAEYAVFRKPATNARYEYLWTGTSQPSLGERFFSDGHYFQLGEYFVNETRMLTLEAEIPGSESSNILPGAAAIPDRNLPGLTASTFGVLIEPGADTEDDESFRERIIEKISNPAENGNRQHYKTWCESVAGVGRARIIPLFAGPNTVMGIIIGADGLPAASAVVDRVQEYIDPMTLGLIVEVAGVQYAIGDGLGDGVANIGAHFAAVAPSALTVNIEFNAELKQGYDEQQIKGDVSAALIAHFKDLSLKTSEREPIVIRISAISSILYSLPGLVDYSDLELNGATGNITLTERQVASLGEVSVNVIV